MGQKYRTGVLIFLKLDKALFSFDEWYVGVDDNSQSACLKYLYLHQQN